MHSEVVRQENNEAEKEGVGRSDPEWLSSFGKPTAASIVGSSPPSVVVQVKKIIRSSSTEEPSVTSAESENTFPKRTHKRKTRRSRRITFTVSSPPMRPSLSNSKTNPSELNYEKVRHVSMDETSSPQQFRSKSIASDFHDGKADLSYTTQIFSSQRKLWSDSGEAVIDATKQNENTLGSANADLKGSRETFSQQISTSSVQSKERGKKTAPIRRRQSGAKERKLRGKRSTHNKEKVPKRIARYSLGLMRTKHANDRTNPHDVLGNNSAFREKTTAPPRQPGATARGASLERSPAVKNVFLSHNQPVTRNTPANNDRSVSKDTKPHAALALLQALQIQFEEQSHSRKDGEDERDVELQQIVSSSSTWSVITSSGSGRSVNEDSNPQTLVLSSPNDKIVPSLNSSFPSKKSSGNEESFSENDKYSQMQAHEPLLREENTGVRTSMASPDALDDLAQYDYEEQQQKLFLDNAEEEFLEDDDEFSIHSYNSASSNRKSLLEAYLLTKRNTSSNRCTQYVAHCPSWASLSSALPAPLPSRLFSSLGSGRSSYPPDPSLSSTKPKGIHANIKGSLSHDEVGKLTGEVTLLIEEEAEAYEEEQKEEHENLSTASQHQPGVFKSRETDSEASKPFHNTEEETREATCDDSIETLNEKNNGQQNEQPSGNPNEQSNGAKLEESNENTTEDTKDIYLTHPSVTATTSIESSVSVSSTKKPLEKDAAELEKDAAEQKLHDTREVKTPETREKRLEKQNQQGQLKTHSTKKAPSSNHKYFGYSPRCAAPKGSAFGVKLRRVSNKPKWLEAPSPSSSGKRVSSSVETKFRDEMVDFMNSAASSKKQTQPVARLPTYLGQQSKAFSCDGEWVNQWNATDVDSKSKTNKKLVADTKSSKRKDVKDTQLKVPLEGTANIGSTLSSPKMTPWTDSQNADKPPAKFLSTSKTSPQRWRIPKSSGFVHQRATEIDKNHMKRTRVIKPRYRRDTRGFGVIAPPRANQKKIIFPRSPTILHARSLESTLKIAEHKPVIAQEKSEKRYHTSAGFYASLRKTDRCDHVQSVRSLIGDRYSTQEDKKGSLPRSKRINGSGSALSERKIEAAWSSASEDRRESESTALTDSKRILELTSLGNKRQESDLTSLSADKQEMDAASSRVDFADRQESASTPFCANQIASVSSSLIVDRRDLNLVSLSADRPEAGSTSLSPDRPESDSTLLSADRPESDSTSLSADRPDSDSASLSADRRESDSTSLSADRRKLDSSSSRADPRELDPSSSRADRRESESDSLSAAPRESDSVSLSAAPLSAAPLSAAPRDSDSASLSAAPRASLSAAPRKSDSASLSADPRELDSDSMSADPRELDSDSLSADPRVLDSDSLSADPRKSDADSLSADPRESDSDSSNADRRESVSHSMNGIQTSGLTSEELTAHDDRWNEVGDDFDATHGKEGKMEYEEHHVDETMSFASGEGLSPSSMREVPSEYAEDRDGADEEWEKGKLSRPPLSSSAAETTNHVRKSENLDGYSSPLSLKETVDACSPVPVQLDPPHDPFAVLLNETECLSERKNDSMVSDFFLSSDHHQYHDDAVAVPSHEELDATADASVRTPRYVGKDQETMDNFRHENKENLIDYTAPTGKLGTPEEAVSNTTVLPGPRSPKALCLSPIQRTPHQARKWRTLAAAAAAKDAVTKKSKGKTNRRIKEKALRVLN